MCGTARSTDVSLKTVAKLLHGAGRCGGASPRTRQGDRASARSSATRSGRVSRETEEPRDAQDAPRVAWTALDRESKPMVSYVLSGGRDSNSAIQFMVDLSLRLTKPPLLVTHALASYNETIQWVYGSNAEHAEHKSGGIPTSSARTSRCGWGGGDSFSAPTGSRSGSRSTPPRSRSGTTSSAATDRCTTARPPWWQASSGVRRHSGT